MDREDIHEKLQNDLISLIRVLDHCMSEIDSYYCQAMKEKMLAGSTNN